MLKWLRNIISVTNTKKGWVVGRTCWQIDSFYPFLVKLFQVHIPTAIPMMTNHQKTRIKKVRADLKISVFEIFDMTKSDVEKLKLPNKKCRLLCHSGKELH